MNIAVVSKWAFRENQMYLYQLMKCCCRGNLVPYNTRCVCFLLGNLGRENTTTNSILFYEWYVLYNQQSQERWSVWKTASNKLRTQGHLLHDPGLRAWWPLRQIYNYQMKSGSLVMESGWKWITTLSSIQSCSYLATE